MRNVLEIMVLSSSCFFARFRTDPSCAYCPYERQGTGGAINAVHGDMFDPEFVTQANFPDGWMTIEVGHSSVAIVPEGVKPPVVASTGYIETLPSVLYPVEFTT